jgi:hypothetical protein
VSARNLRRSIAPLLLLTAAYVCLSAGGALAEGLLYVAPALALACLLLARRYPGERLLIALRPQERRRRARVRATRMTGAPIALGMPRGGLLMARSLAVRPPPLALGVS